MSEKTSQQHFNELKSGFDAKFDDDPHMKWFRFTLKGGFLCKGRQCAPGDWLYNAENGSVEQAA